jgi:anti-sigma factor RsiW
MTDRSQLSEEELADLVAYLDGEVDAETARSIEAKLNLDPTARAEAEALQRSFDLLEYLPQREPSANFTHRTVEKIATLRPPSAVVPHHRGPWPTWALGAGWAAAVVLAAMLGFGGSRFLAPRPQSTPTEPAELDQQLVRDLGVIENKQLYDLVDDLDFLRTLAEPDLFGEDG